MRWNVGHCSFSSDFHYGTSEFFQRVPLSWFAWQNFNGTNYSSRLSFFPPLLGGLPWNHHFTPTLFLLVWNSYFWQILEVWTTEECQPPSDKNRWCRISTKRLLALTSDAPSGWSLFGCSHLFPWQNQGTQHLCWFTGLTLLRRKLDWNLQNTCLAGFVFILTQCLFTEHMWLIDCSLNEYISQWPLSPSRGQPETRGAPSEWHSHSAAEASEKDRY